MVAKRAVSPLPLMREFFFSPASGLECRDRRPLQRRCLLGVVVFRMRSKKQIILPLALDLSRMFRNVTRPPSQRFGLQRQTRNFVVGFRVFTGPLRVLGPDSLEIAGVDDV